MNNTLLPGVSGEARHRVVTENLVSFRREGMPPVLATPWVLDVMETAAYNAIRPHPGRLTSLTSLALAETKITDSQPPSPRSWQRGTRNGLSRFPRPFIASRNRARGRVREM